MNPKGQYGLLITAIVVVIIIAMVYAFFLQPGDDLAKEIKKGIEIAQVSEGKTIEPAKASLNIKAGQSVSAENFEDKTTLVVFKCSDALLCCEDEKACNNALSIDTESKILEVKKDTGIKPYFRCMYEHNLYVCKVFFGAKPAQVEIKELNALKTIDLSKSNKLNINVLLENSGSLVMQEELTARVKVFDRKDNNPLKEPVFEGEKTFSKLKAGETASENIEAEISYTGSFDVKVSVESEESGKDEKTVKVEALGIPQTSCKALQKESPEVYSEAGSIEELRGKCVSKAYCVDCLTSFECRNAWLSKEASVVAAGNDYAYIIELPQLCNE